MPRRPRPTGSRATPRSRSSGTASMPSELYRKRAAGVVTIYRPLRRQPRATPRRPPRRAPASSSPTDGYILTNSHVVTTAGETDPASSGRRRHGLRPVPRRRAGPGRDRRLGRLRRRRRPQGRSRRPSGQPGAARRFGRGRRRRAGRGDRQPLRTGELAERRRRLGDRALDRLDHLRFQPRRRDPDGRADQPRATRAGRCSTPRGDVIGINAQIRSESGTAEGVGLRGPDQRRAPLDGAADPDGQGALRLARRHHADRDAAIAERFGFARTAAPPCSRVASRQPRRPRPGFAAATTEQEFEGIPFCPGGDLIVAIDGKPVDSAEDVVRAVNQQRFPGDEIRLTVLRGSERLDADGDARRPAGEPADAGLLALVDSPGGERPTRTTSSSATTWRSCRAFDDGSFQLVYTDPPFNTGADAAAADPRHGGAGRTATGPASAGGATRRAFSASPPSPTPSTTTSASSSRACGSCAALLDPTGTLYLHLDYREAHYAKVLLDELFGRDCFLNEIVWAYDYGGAAAAPLAGQARHDPRLRQGPERYWFDAEAVEREPYMAPGLVTAGEGRAREAADRRLVAHDRVADREGEDRLPDPEAGGDRFGASSGVLAAGRLVPRSVRRLGHARSGLRGSSAAASSWSTRAPRRSKWPASALEPFRAAGAAGTWRASVVSPRLVPAGARFRQIRASAASDARDRERTRSQRASSLSSSRRRPSTSLSGRLALTGLLRRARGGARGDRRREARPHGGLLELDPPCLRRRREGEVEMRYELAESNLAGRGVGRGHRVRPDVASRPIRPSSTRAASASRSSVRSPTS